MMDGCIEQCLAVVWSASRCVDDCLSGSQDDSMTECIRLCLDAATMTAACAELMSRNSQFAAQVCGVCVDVCDACAAECEKYEGDIMRQCAEACRRCAETCRQMAA